MFATLTKLLHVYSSAASAPVECMLSTAGLVANDKRSNLTAEEEEEEEEEEEKEEHEEQQEQEQQEMRRFKLLF